MIKVFFHKADFDGVCSAVLIKEAYPECTLIPIDYSDEKPLYLIDKEDTVFMVDFAFEPFEYMIKLRDSCARLIWIDHHKTAIEKAEEVRFKVDGLLDMKSSGCENTWKYLYQDKPMPDFVHYLGRYDVFDLYDKSTIYFEYGLKAEEDSLNPNASVWSKLLSDNNEVNRIIDNGKTVYAYYVNNNKEYFAKYGYFTVFKGLKALVLNRGLPTSMCFDSFWDPDKYDIMIAFCRSKDRWSISFYSTKPEVDCANIAEEFNGGGHAGASGCSVENIDFLLRK